MKNRNLILCVLCVFALAGSAQEKLKRVVEKDKVSKLTETYYVLDDEPSIKEGSYQLQGADKKVYISGEYKKNTRVGVWTFSNKAGEVSRRFNFERDSVVEYVWGRNDSTRLRVKTANGWKLKEVSSPPFPMYGDLSFIINRSLTYPEKAKKEGVQGTVVVGVRIDRTGVRVASGVRKSVDSALDKEALRVVNMIDVWYPAVCEGRKTECEYLISVPFVLKK